jgi:AAA family ATP:ADP antiporter
VLQGLSALVGGGTALLGLVRIFENWTFSLFFGTAELWGTISISVLFWTLANDVCTVDEAKSVYPLMGNWSGGGS